MAINQFNLAVSASVNGTGAPSATNLMGPTKTVALTTSNAGDVIAIEVANDAGGAAYSELFRLTSGDSPVTFVCWTNRMRTRRIAVGGATAPIVSVGVEDAELQTTSRTTLAIAAGIGTAAGTDTSAFGILKTLQITGGSPGDVVAIEISDDAGTTWRALQAAEMHFGDGPKTLNFVAGFVRTNRLAIGSGSAPVVTLMAGISSESERYLATPTSNGLVASAGGGAAFGRTLQAGAGIALTNPDGVAGDPSIALSVPITRGNTTLVAGTKTIATANVTANSVIHVTPIDPANCANTTSYSAPNASRVVGTPGSFEIRANVAAGTINAADTSTVGWTVEG